MNKYSLFAIVFLALFGYLGVWQWTVCRVYVPPGEMLVLTSRFGDENPDTENLRVVDEGKRGIQKKVLGEGRYFVNPLLYEYRRAPVISIGNDEIGVIRSQTGQPPEDRLQFLVEPSEDIYARKGVWRHVLTPGLWRYNPDAFQVEVLKAVKILPGFVGCVTAMSGQPPAPGKLARRGQSGVQEHVLQPGVYYANPKAVRIDSVEIGYREFSPTEAVTFFSKDGFNIQLEVTVVWGLKPGSVPSVIMHFGNVDEIVHKVIVPQVESICRIEGSKYGAKELLEGDSREQFQEKFRQLLTKVCEEKQITVRLGLVRSIDVPMDIRQPIQMARIAVEERRTKEEQQATQASVNQLAELQSDVEKGVREVAAGTEKAVAEVRADGEKQVATLQAEQLVAVAAIEKQVAELEAQRTLLLGQAEATVTQLAREAAADALKQNVDAIGGAAAYSNYQFANKLSSSFNVFIRYAGPGTFWTDLPAGAKNLSGMADLKVLDAAK
ncbi:MAG: hypothetical protein HY816_05390 [Candidatus Wallbacteria bacterium]|nr:hypothetical protein [Candidatus Wallbacteria bacterium]